MADLNALASKYRSGEVTLEQLKSQYKLSTSDIEKIKQINAKIDKELGVKDGTQPLHGSTEITLKGGAKVLAAKIETHTQPGGGHTDVYMSADGQRYYQYTSAGGEKSEITDSWHSWNETSDKWSIAWQKHKEGNTMEALKLLIQDIEDPTGKIVFSGTAGEYVGVKSIGSIKGLWNVAKNLPQTAKNSWQTIKSFGSWVSKFKEVKNFEQFKSLAMNFIQKMKPKKVANSATKQQVKQMKSFEQIQKEYYMEGVKNLKDNYNIEVVATRRQILHGLREEPATVDIIYQGKKYNIEVISYRGNGVENEGNVLKTFFERLKNGKNIEEILRDGVLPR